MQEKLQTILVEKGIDYEVLRHEPVVTIDDVKRVLKIPYDQMAKTLVVGVGDQICQAILSGYNRLDRKKLAQTLGVSQRSVDMFSREKVTEKIGIPIGAIPPFGLGYKVVLDERLLGQDWIYCGFGSLTSSLKIHPQDLVSIAGAVVADITLH